jgi:hypothetical protein
MKQFILAGKVVSKTNNSGIAGLSVHAVPQELKRDLTATLTNEDGGFHFIFQENELPENAKIQIVVYSIDKKEVSITKKIVPVKFTTQSEVEITVDDELIREHLSKTISLKPVEGRIFPVEKLNQIYGAINFYGNTKHKYSFDGDIKPGLTCPFPELNDFDHILIDAWETIQGNPSAFQRFKNSLDTVALSMEKRRGLKTRIDFNDAKWESYIKEKRLNHGHDAIDHDPMVPLEKSALLMMGAKYIAGKNKNLANRYMNVVLSQLLEFYDVAPIYRTCRDAMLGDASARSNVRHMIAIWGEDCQGRNPLPDVPGGREWNPREELIDPHLEDTLACLNDLANGLGSAEVQEYSIDSLTPNNGCSGDIAVISGSGFGEVAGQVRFVGATINSSVFVAPNSWTDTQIEVAIPSAATFGPIDLVFPFRLGHSVCGRVTSVQYRNISDRSTHFIGGRPRIDSISFTKNNIPFDPMTETVLPGDSVSLIYENSPNVPRHSVDIRESQINFVNGQFKPSVLIQEFNVLFQGSGGSPHSNRQLQAMNYDRSTKIICEINLVNHCGTTHGNAYFIVHRPATISLTGIELTQATQFFRTSEHMNQNSGEQKPDNSVPLIAGKRTLARVYYTTDQVSSFNGGRSFGLSVELTARKDGNALDAGICFNSNVLFASNDNTVLTQRGQLTSSANFLLSGTWIGPTVFTEPVGELVRLVNAPLQIKARLGIRDFEPWIRDRIAPLADEFTLDGLFFNHARTLRIMLGRYTIVTPNAGTFGRPGLNACANTLRQISEAYPTHELEIISPFDGQEKELHADLTDTSGGNCGNGWNSLMVNLGLIALSPFDDDIVRVGMVNADTPLDRFGGCGNAVFKLAGFPVNRHTTGMQEIGHAFGRDHPIQSDSTPPNDPTFPNYRGDGTASIGEFGVAVADINPGDQSNLNSLVFDPDEIRDFMSIARNMPLPLDGRWVSPHTYKGLMVDFFVARARASDTTSAFADVLPRDKSEQIVIRGTIDLDADKVMLKPLFHEWRSTLHGKGKTSPYAIELLNDSGRVIYTAPILTDGHGGSTFTFNHYTPYLKDCRFIQVKKGDALLAKVERKEGSPAVRALKMHSCENTRTISWEVGGTTEYWCCVELTCNDGNTWIRLNEPEKNTAFSFDASKYGGGDNCRLRVMITDGFNTSLTETDSFSLPLKPPQVALLNFDDGAEFIAGQTYDLKAVPVYIVGVPHQTELLWFLDDKEIGKGKKVSVQFEEGKHKIRIVPEKFKEAAVVVQVIARKEDT